MNNRLRVYGLELILLIVLSIALVFNYGLNNRIKVSIFLFCFAMLTKILLKKNRTLSIHKKKILKLMCLMAFVYVGILYTLGIYAGFYRATIKFSITTIIKYIIPISIIIYSSELIRTKFLNYDTKISNILNFIIQVIIDLLIYASVFKFKTFEELMVIIGYVLFASIACNLVYNYVSKRYGMKPNIIYRIITILYIYIIPVIPDIYIFFLSFYRMMYPFAVYYILDSFYGEQEESTNLKYLIRIRILSSLSFIILLVYIGLISNTFTIGALVIGSGSMKGTIDKGDVIIFSKHLDEKDINIGDIIIFKKNDVKVVHRVIDIKNAGGEYRFYTKGDNNKLPDSGYITSSDLYGTVKLKVDKIGLPTIWLHDIFDNAKSKKEV